MNLVKVKHSMDKEFRVMTVNEAFLEALSLSSGRTCAIEELESDLLNLINNFIEKGHEEYILDIIKDEYKLSVLKGWEYEVEEFDSDLVMLDRGKCNTKCYFDLALVDTGEYNIAYTCIEDMQTEE